MRERTRTNNKLFHANEFDITHLIREALRIPEGLHEEVYFDSQECKVSFSMPSTNQFINSKNKVGVLHALRIDEFAGLKTVNGGGLRNATSVEVDIDSRFYDALTDWEKRIVKGKHYDQAIHISFDEAIDRIADYLINHDPTNIPEALKTNEERRYCYHLMYLFEKIMRKADKK